MIEEALIENRTFEEIRVGESASVTRTLREHDIKLFEVVTGDVIAGSIDGELSATNTDHPGMAPGTWVGGLISAARH